MPEGPKTVSFRCSLPASCSFIIAVAVRSLDTDATLIIKAGDISIPSSLSAQP